MEWTSENIARLKQLWAEGLSTAEIGRRMGVSKNAIVGKAHRLLLESRPSPIRRDVGDRPARIPQPRRVVGPTLPSLAAPPPRIDNAPLDASPTLADLSPAPRPAPTLVPSRPFAAERRRHHACCWPIGEPGTREFHFCDADSLPGKPYCEAHAALAYVKIRDRREDAA